ncbi:hypothetical protein M6B38_336235 [Iris pallida]|uniref:Uncharacterized protein n=1 Tax=Iris pallida TaxID=29817 RepID=A0AAX6GZS5_IRIPA|nr:hypothetical protein M6B38_336235 [Iris pallida]
MKTEVLVVLIPTQPARVAPLLTGGMVADHCSHSLCFVLAWLCIAVALRIIIIIMIIIMMMIKSWIYQNRLCCNFAKKFAEASLAVPNRSLTEINQIILESPHCMH